MQQIDQSNMLIQEELAYQSNEPDQNYKVKKITEESDKSVSFKQRELSETAPDFQHKGEKSKNQWDDQSLDLKMNYFEEKEVMMKAS